MGPLLSKILRTQASNWATVPLRLAVGTVMVGHGGQKLFGWWGGFGLEATAGFFANNLNLKPGLLWAILAGAGELVGGIALLLGLATRLFALNTAVIMAVAIALAHSEAFFNQNRGMEFPLTLLAASIALMISGGGALSVDSAWARSPRRL